MREKNGRLIPDLNKDDFQLEEDQQPQVIRYFARETDTPLTMGIMVDTSPSQGRVLEVEKSEAEAFLQEVMRPKDLTFVMHFDVEVELLQDFTADLHLLDNAIDENEINGGGVRTTGTFPSGDTGGATHLYDAVYLSAREVLKNEVGRKVLILLTDGEDQGSKVKLDAALEAAQKSDVIIYSVEISDRAFYRRAGDGLRRRLGIAETLRGNRWPGDPSEERRMILPWHSSRLLTNSARSIYWGIRPPIPNSMEPFARSKSKFPTRMSR